MNPPPQHFCIFSGVLGRRARSPVRTLYSLKKEFHTIWEKIDDR